MNKFDINKIIEYWHLDKAELAPVLFPQLKHPDLALVRVLSGESQLSITQLEALANFIGITASDLLNTDSWQGLYEESTLVLKKGAYMARFKYNRHFAILYKNNKMIGQFICPDGIAPMSEVLNYIDNQIKNYENGNNQN